MERTSGRGGSWPEKRVDEFLDQIPTGDSLPAGDLIYLKLVGRLDLLGRRATVEEVEEFFAPFAPFRGLAATWLAQLVT